MGLLQRVSSPLSGPAKMWNIFVGDLQRGGGYRVPQNLEKFVGDVDPPVCG